LEREQEKHARVALLPRDEKKKRGERELIKKTQRKRRGTLDLGNKKRTKQSKKRNLKKLRIPRKQSVGRPGKQEAWSRLLSQPSGQEMNPKLGRKCENQQERLFSRTTSQELCRNKKKRIRVNN